MSRESSEYDMQPAVQSWGLRWRKRRHFSTGPRLCTALLYTFTPACCLHACRMPACLLAVSAGHVLRGNGVQRHGADEPVPIEIASDTPMVLKRIPCSPASVTPALTCPARSSRCMLHGLPSHHTLAIPICALCISAAVMPVAYSIACDAPCESSCEKGQPGERATPKTLSNHPKRRVQTSLCLW